MTNPAAETPRPTLRIRPAPPAATAPGCRRWLFLSYGNGHESLDARWGIEHRADGWWGLVSFFPWTHERHLPLIAEEMALASEAMRQLKAEGKKLQ